MSETDRKALADGEKVFRAYHAESWASWNQLSDLGKAQWARAAAAFRADAGAQSESLIGLLREVEPTVARHGNEIVLYCEPGDARDKLYDALEAAVCSPDSRSLPLAPASETGRGS